MSLWETVVYADQLFSMTKPQSIIAVNMIYVTLIRTATIKIAHRRTDTPFFDGQTATTKLQIYFWKAMHKTPHMTVRKICVCMLIVLMLYRALLPRSLYCILCYLKPHLMPQFIM
jgi:hypothetical protein